MKKLFIVLMPLLVIYWTEAFAFPPYYSSDVDPNPNIKTFVDTHDLPLGEQVTIDIYLSDVPGYQISGGAWIDFTASTARISYVSGGRCMLDGSEVCTGPWHPGGLFLNEPLGPGTVMYVVSGGVGGEPPDEDGDLIIGRVVLERIGAGEASILFTTIPDVGTWAPLDDADILSHTLIITDDFDGDGVANSDDNCPETPNQDQLDTYPPGGNGIGDACDCECDFDCNGSVDANDITSFLADFGRNAYSEPCVFHNPCNGDVDCNGTCDADDVTKFLEDFGRNQYNNPCPPCEVGDWCVGGNICQNNDDCSFFYTFCEKTTGQCDGEGICEIMPSSIPFLYDPVCGCDGNTYINWCLAWSSRQSIDYWGACIE